MNAVSSLLASALLKRGSQIAKPPLKAAAGAQAAQATKANAPALRGSAARRPRRGERRGERVDIDESGSQLPVARALRPALEAEEVPRRGRAAPAHVSDGVSAASSLKPKRLASR